MNIDDLQNAQAYPIDGRMPLLTRENRDKVRRGVKTQTRRVMKNPHWSQMDDQAFYAGIAVGVREGLEFVHCPYGHVGDIRVMPEPLTYEYNPQWYDEDNRDVYYADDMVYRRGLWLWKIDPLPAMFMPTNYGRVLVRYTRLWAEWLQDISAKDAMAEGVAKAQNPINRMTIEALGDSSSTGLAAIEDYAILWDSINAAPKPIRVNGVIVRYESYPWEAIRETREHRGKLWLVIGNPWVWCIEWELL